MLYRPLVIGMKYLCTCIYKEHHQLYLHGGPGPNLNICANAILSVARFLNKIKAKLNFSKILLLGQSNHT